MDTFMKKIEQLADMAAKRPDPVPLDVSGVMARVRGLEIEEESLSFPVGFLAAGLAAAAAVALVVSIIAAHDWAEMSSSPQLAISKLVDVMDVML